MLRSPEFSSSLLSCELREQTEFCKFPQIHLSYIGIWIFLFGNNFRLWCLLISFSSSWYKLVRSSFVKGFGKTNYNFVCPLTIVMSLLWNEFIVVWYLEHSVIYEGSCEEVWWHQGRYSLTISYRGVFEWTSHFCRYPVTWQIFFTFCGCIYISHVIFNSELLKKSHWHVKSTSYSVDNEITAVEHKFYQKLWSKIYLGFLITFYL